MNNNINVCIIDDDDVFQYTILHTLQVHKSVNNIIPFTDGAEAMTFLKANINTSLNVGIVHLINTYRNLVGKVLTL